MHIAYSALKNKPRRVAQIKAAIPGQRRLRFKAYQATCIKYRKEIAAIQKYMPGWLPTCPEY